MKSPIRQMKGPGMNIGLKKPRLTAKPKKISLLGGSSLASPTAPANSYLPSGPFGATPKPKKPRM